VTSASSDHPDSFGHPSPLSSLQRLRPFRTDAAPVFPSLPEPEPWSIPITRSQIILNLSLFLKDRPLRLRPQRSTFSGSTRSRTRLAVPFIPVPLQPPVFAMFAICSVTCVTCSSDASRTSTTSSDEVVIHTSEAFKDIEPPCTRRAQRPLVRPPLRRVEDPGPTPPRPGFPT
jgi:hypothetical protein